MLSEYQNIFENEFSDKDVRIENIDACSIDSAFEHHALFSVQRSENVISKLLGNLYLKNNFIE